MSTPIIRGSSIVHDHHTGGRIEIAEKSKKETFVLQGLYEDLKAQLPRIGGRFRGLRVSTAELIRAKGGMGLLTVTCLRSTGGGGGNAVKNADETVYEVEMAQLEKPLLSHPRYKDYADQVEAWRGGDPATRAAMKYTDVDGEEVVLAGNAEKAARLIMQGVESYLVFAPVCRRTSRTNEAVEDAVTGIGKDCGKKQRPPAKLLGMTAGTWQWLKTADRAVETAGGGAERVEEWTGADEWSDDLYEQA